VARAGRWSTLAGAGIDGWWRSRRRRATARGVVEVATAGAPPPDYAIVRRVLDAHRPRPVGGDAADPQVAADVHAGAGGAGGDQFGHHDVGGQALADAAGVEAGAGGEAHLVPVDHDVGAPGDEGAGAPAGDRAAVQRPHVAGPQDSAEHRGIEGPAADAPRLDGPLHEEGHGLGRVVVAPHPSADTVRAALLVDREDQPEAADVGEAGGVRAPADVRPPDD
jgi:hypothetical protein